ncbi:hypothetical protein DEM27_14510 [Metarhizobium album]|uniref:Uncharacterized protein n=1 Tax=Metarhizobium album TaxID=2182425 RepID=A0A2U2DPP5_9HYPH|nr:hypothetical protein [Rhizobium album]PWE55284.1 hypothetical protein DEM27_14510 [Rhizobium album]
MRSLDHCPNCKREFYAHAQDAYCEECWRAWCKNDGTFEERTKPWVSLIETPAPKNILVAPNLHTPEVSDRTCEVQRRNHLVGAVGLVPNHLFEVGMMTDTPKTKMTDVEWKAQLDQARVSGFAEGIERAAKIADEHAAHFEKQAATTLSDRSHDAFLLAADACELTADAIRAIMGGSEP